MLAHAARLILPSLHGRCGWRTSTTTCPTDRIAQVPIEPRDAARLLVDRGDAPPEHRHVAELPDLLHEGDVVVVNESRVIPARLRLRRATGGAAEVLLLEPVTADDGAGRR